MRGAFTAEHEREFEPLPAADVLARSHVGDGQDARDALVREGYLRLWPHRHATDGFFAAVWQRR